MKQQGLTTKALHTKQARKDAHGSIHTPVYDNASFEFETAEDLELAFQGKKPSHMYSRISNPTIEAFELKVRNITNAKGVLANSSGMAAISNTIMSVVGQGENIITSNHVFGNTYSLFETTLKQWGLETKYADMTNIKDVEKLIDDKTRVIFLETITNPQLEVANLAKLGELAKKHEILLIVDSTVTPLSYFIDAKKLGIHIEVISSTKYISGGATSVGGIIVDYGNFKWKNNPHLADYAKKFGPFALLTKLRKESYRNMGACLSPHNAFLQSIGLETMALRVEKSCANSLAIAKFLEKHPSVESVNYPGLECSQFYDISKEQFGDKFGALLTFNLKSKEECFKFMNRLKLIRRATNLNDNRSLIIHPSSTIFVEFSDELKNRMGVYDNLIRLAVGIEDIEDLIEEIEQGLMFNV